MINFRPALIFLFWVPLCFAQLWDIGVVSFSGNQVFSKDDLQQIIKIRPSGFLSPVRVSFEQVVSDREALEAFYRRSGYYNILAAASLRQEGEEGRASVIFFVAEGPRFSIDTIQFRGNEVFSDSFYRSLVRVSSGDALDSSLVELGRLIILDTLRNRGYLFSNVLFSITLNRDSAEGSVIYYIDEGPVVEAGELVVTGLEKVQQEVVERELYFEKGEVLTPEKISRSVSKLNGTELFSSVYIEPLDTVQGGYGDTAMVPVLVIVQEGDMAAVQLGGGYGAFQGWYGQAKLLYRNLFGLGNSISLQGRLSSVEKGLTLAYQYPHFLELPLSATTELFYERRTEDSYSGNFYGGSFQLSSPLRESLFWSVQARAELVNDFKAEDSTPLFPQNMQKNTFLLGTGIQYDNRAGFLRTRGTFSELRLEVAGPFLPQTSQFYRLMGGGQFYYPFFGNMTAVSAFQGAFGRGYGEDAGLLPESQRFRIGFGFIPALRGYSEEEVMPRDELGNVRGAGALMVFTPLELRIPLFWYFQGALFVDGGAAWRDASSVDLTDVKWAFGPGLILRLPFVALRVDYGIQAEDFSGRFHLSAGAF